MAHLGNVKATHFILFDVTKWVPSSFSIWGLFEVQVPQSNPLYGPPYAIQKPQIQLDTVATTSV